MIDYSKIPTHCRESVKEYIEHGRPMGDFLTAVFANDFVRAVSHADTINTQHIRDYAMFLYNSAPMSCWGSIDKIKAWQDQGGLRGNTGG